MFGLLPFRLVVCHKTIWLYNVDIIKKFVKDQALNKKYIAEKDDF